MISTLFQVMVIACSVPLVVVSIIFDLVPIISFFVNIVLMPSSKTPQLRDRFAFPEDLTNFIQNMSLDGCYGDELCIQALAQVLQIHIEVFTPEHPIQSFGSPNNPNIKLAYNGVDHFDVILPIRPPVHNAVPSAPKLSDTKVPLDKNTKDFVIISANITSLRKNWDVLKLQHADIYCCQETTLNFAGQNSMKRTLASQGFMRYLDHLPSLNSLAHNEPFLFGMQEAVA